MGNCICNQEELKLSKQTVISSYVPEKKNSIPLIKEKKSQKKFGEESDHSCHNSSTSTGLSPLLKCKPQRLNRELFETDFFENKTIQTTQPKMKERCKLKTDGQTLLAIYGSEASGKTSFSLRMCRQKVSNFYIPSVSDENVVKQCIINQKKTLLRMSIPKISDAENLDNIEIIYAECYLVFFDITSTKSFEFAKKFIQKKLSNVKEPIFLVANKCDLKTRPVKVEVIKKFVEDYKLNYFEISTLTEGGLIKLKEDIGHKLEH